MKLLANLARRILASCFVEIAKHILLFMIGQEKNLIGKKKSNYAKHLRNAGTELRPVVRSLISSRLSDAQGGWSIRPSFLTGFLLRP